MLSPHDGRTPATPFHHGMILILLTNPLCHCPALKYPSHSAIGLVRFYSNDAS